MRTGFDWRRLFLGLLFGAVLGVCFGAAFGWTASWFEMGPEPWQGIRESAPWFAIVFAFGGFLMSLEQEGRLLQVRDIE